MTSDGAAGEGESLERLALTDEQRRLLADHSGRTFRTVPISPTLAAAVDLHLQAQAMGHRFGDDGVVTFPLSPSQADEVLEVTGLRLTSWVVDVDAGRTRYDEKWAATTHVVGDGLRVTVSSAPTAPEADEIILRPPPDGEALFGTGEHPATRLAIRFLEQHLHPGDRVADIGTGSGILALVAVRLGAAAVVAVDTDRDALATAAQNVAVNGASERILLLPDRLRPVDTGFDLLVANLLAGVVVELLPSLAPVVVPGGRLVFSGIATRRATSVIDVGTSLALDLDGTIEDGVWTAITFRRRSDPG